MNCKFCQAEMEEGVTVCPTCGKNNGKRTVSEKKKLTSGKLAVIYISILVVVALLAAVAITGINNGALDDFFASIISSEGRIPRDGNKDDVTCQGSYTVSDRKAVSKAEKVVATAGEGQLTNEQLQIHYWMQVYNFIGSYGEYASTYGLNLNKPLDRQICSMTQDGWTWQQYFLGLALRDWQMYNAFCQEAEAVGYEIKTDMELYLNDMMASLEESANSQGYKNVEDMVHHDMGAGASVDGYLAYMELLQRGYEYYNYMYDNLVPTEDQVRAYYEENTDLFDENGIYDDGSKLVDARHVLIKTADTKDDAAWAEAEKKAQDLMDQWLKGDKTEESFAAMANEHSEDGGSNKVGGLYTYIAEGEMLQAFSDWCFEEGRKSGDYGIVKTQIGYHLMYYVQDQPVWYVYAKNSAKNQLANDTITALLDKYAAQVDYESIVLGFVDQSGESAPVATTVATTVE